MTKLFIAFFFYHFAFNPLALAKNCLESSMELPVQDQDGLGTCYANVAALMVQNKLKLPEPVSYHHLALVKADQKRGRDLINEKASGDIEYKGDGGNVCRLLNTIKKKGFCEARYFSIDYHQANDQIQLQNKFITSFGKMLDQLAKKSHRMKDSDWDKLADQMAIHLLDKKKNICEKSLEQFYLDQLESQLAEHLLKRKEVIDQEAKRVSDLYQEKNDIHIKSNLDNLTQSQAFWDTLIKESTESIPLQGDQNKLVIKKESLAQLKPYLNQWTQMPSLVGANLLEVKYNSPIEILVNGIKNIPDHIKKEHQAEYHNDLGSYFLLEQIGHQKKVCDHDLNPEIADNIFTPINSNLQCLAQLYPQDLIDLREQTDQIISMLKNNRIKRKKVRSDMLTELLAPGCLEQAERNRKLLQKTRCESLSLSGQLLNPLFTTKYLKRANPEKLKRQANQWIMDKLCDQQAVGISVCSEFMFLSDPDFDSRFCQQRSGDKSAHYNHAMTIVGHKTMPDGKLRYLVQNSWGKSCGISFAKEKAERIECQKDENGDTGRFWIDSELLLNNTHDLSVLR